MDKKMIVLTVGIGCLIFGFASMPEAYGYACIGVGGFVFGCGLAINK